MEMKKNINKALVLLLLGLSIASIHAGQAAPTTAPAQQSGCQTFTETGKAACGRFLQYWQMNGGLAQQGFPISDLLGEKSPTDGTVHTVQYFERAEFEYHPENQPPYDVQLTLLGALRYQQKYPDGAPKQNPDPSPDAITFKETGHRMGGPFLEYWQQHGGLAQQGYPISNIFGEKSDLDGKTYSVQYTQRAAFEWHSELKAPNVILLSQLGTFRYQQLYSAGGEAAPPVTLPPAIPNLPTPTPIATATAQPTVKPTPTVVRISGQQFLAQVADWETRYGVILQDLYNSALEGRGWDDTAKSQVNALNLWIGEVMQGQYNTQAMPDGYGEIVDHLVNIARTSQYLANDLTRGFQYNDQVIAYNKALPNPNYPPQPVTWALKAFNDDVTSLTQITQEWATIDRWVTQLGGS